MIDMILCVDDDPSILKMFKVLEACPEISPHHIQFETMQEAANGLVAITERGPYSVIVSDMQMPGMNGIQFLSRVRQIAPDSVRMMLTGCGDVQVAIDAVNDGHIFRFLTKPCTVTTLVQAIRAGVAQYRLITAEKELLAKTLTASIQVLTDLLGLASPVAFGRATRVRDLVKRLAIHLKIENPWQLEVAAMLSQIGCVTVPESVLRRVYRGADLDPDERQVFVDHARVGHNLIAKIPRLQEVAAAIAYQEKHFDGAGEPADERKGEEIPLSARVLKATLDLDGLESKGFSRIDALECIKQRIGWYDPNVIAALEAILRAESGMVLKEVSLQSLLDKLALVHNPHLTIDQSSFQQKFGRMLLAENVWTTKEMLILSKGHEMTVPLLERLRNYSRNAVIREPIKVWVSASEMPS